MRRRVGLRRTGILGGSRPRMSDKRKALALKLTELRLFVLERDGYRCRYCRANNRALDPHHIEKRSQRPDLLLEALNVITLCRPCHDWTDADPMGKQGRLKVERHGSEVLFWIDYEGRLARQATAFFLSRGTQHPVVENLCVKTEKKVNASAR